MLRFIPARAGNTARPQCGSVARAVHPRAGGEHGQTTVRLGRPSGSSPRGRGTLRSDRQGRAGIRFIPARAGNTRCSSSRPSTRSVHPRAGGEHSFRRSSSPSLTGSSPRGRGTRHTPGFFLTMHRFIPARAGNTPSLGGWDCSNPVHPRAGGEHRRIGLPPEHYCGSSPRGRGTQGSQVREGELHRFIPARAGNTWRAGRPVDRPLGSSPRGRGTLASPATAPSPPRFIPARAGNTSSAPVRVETLPVHPRAGGEHFDECFATAFAHGSSPRGRGTRDVHAASEEDPRFIPARAGNTVTTRRTQRAISVHPRAGGEHVYGRSPGGP